MRVEKNIYRRFEGFVVSFEHIGLTRPLCEMVIQRFAMEWSREAQRCDSFIVVVGVLNAEIALSFSIMVRQIRGRNGPCRARCPPSLLKVNFAIWQSLARPSEWLCRLMHVCVPSGHCRQGPVD